jgi:hypothetical protein
VGYPVVSTRTVPSPESVTRARLPFGRTATLVGVVPVATRVVTFSVTVSTTDTVPSPELAV